MRIEILYVPGCPNYEAAKSSVNEALRTEKMVAVVDEVEVSDAAAAQTLRFPGSPTIRIYTVDTNRGRTGKTQRLSCRCIRHFHLVNDSNHLLGAQCLVDATFRRFIVRTAGYVKDLYAHQASLLLLFGICKIGQFLEACLLLCASSRLHLFKSAANSRSSCLS